MELSVLSVKSELSECMYFLKMNYLKMLACKKVACNHFQGAVVARRIADLLAELLIFLGVSQALQHSSFCTIHR